MSVRLESIKAGSYEEVCNSTWKAVTALGYCYEGEKVPIWNGHHDPQQWSAEQCSLMATRLEQASKMIPILKDLAANGGVTIS